MNRHTGFTLVELIISISAGSALMMLAVGLLHRTMTTHSMARNQLELRSTGVRLAQQFRRDVHRSNAVEIQGDAAGKRDVVRGGRPPRAGIQHVVLSGEQTTTYTISGGTVTREQRLGAGKVQRETYSFGGAAAARIDKAVDPPRLELSVFDGGASGSGPPRGVLRVEAVVGRLHLPVGSPEESE